MMLRRLLILSLLAAILVIAGCSSGSEDSQDTDSKKGTSNANDANKGTVTIGYNQWPARIATANMWKLVLEEKGYTVNLQAGSKGPLFTGLSNGDIDILSQVWLPFADKPYAEKYKETTVKHEKWYEKAPLGLAVPEYVDIDSISQLNKNKEDFNGEIVGIEPGASLMKLSEKALNKYELNYELIQSSGSAMMSSLGNAIKKEEPIVVTLWEPHWAFSVYDLKFLKDPENIYGDSDDIYWFSRSDFEKDFPEVTKYFNQWDMTHEQMSSLMNTIRKAGEPEKGAKQWISENQELVDEWTK